MLTKMAEINFVAKKDSLSYDGVLSIPEFYLTIDTWLKEKGYDKLETKNEEIVEKNGKYVELILEPWKKLTDYSKSVIRIHIRMHNITDVTVEIDGNKKNLNKGKVVTETEGFMMNDYEDRWESHPMYYFIRTIFDKFFFSIYTKKNADHVVGDVKDLRATIKSFLNLYRIKLEK